MEKWFNWIGIIAGGLTFLGFVWRLRKWLIRVIWPILRHIRLQWPITTQHTKTVPSASMPHQPDDSGEILIDGYVLIRNYADVKLGQWLLMAVSAKGVEVDRDVMSGLITGSGLYDKTVAVGYQEVLEKWGSTYSANRYGSIVWGHITCTWKSSLGWVSDYPIRVLKHPLVKYLVCDVYGHHVPAQFEIVEKTMGDKIIIDEPEGERREREATTDAPVIIAPEVGATDVLTTPILAWSVIDGATYDVQISLDATFGILAESATPPTNAYVVTTALAEGQSYYWRVRAVTDAGAGDWATGVFTTATP